MRGGMPPVRGGGSMGMGGGPMMFRGMNRPIRGRMGQPMYGYGRGAMRMPMVRTRDVDMLCSSKSNIDILTPTLQFYVNYIW